jgi:hypothetical protein
MPLSRRIAFVSSARHETFDPTFLISPRTSWGVGLSFQMGRTTPDSVNRDDQERNLVVLRVPLRESGSAPSVAGDFTKWKPVPMTRYDHEWRLPLSLDRGVYYFAFRGADGKWFVPASVPHRVSDGMGGTVGVLVIP